MRERDMKPEFTEELQERVADAIDADVRIDELKKQMEGPTAELVKVGIELVKVMMSHVPEEFKDQAPLITFVRPLAEGMAINTSSAILDELDPGWLEKAQQEMVAQMMSRFASETTGSEGSEEDYKQVLH